jgi:hypothetical protein
MECRSVGVLRRVGIAAASRIEDAGFEDEDDDENEYEAPGEDEWESFFSLPCATLTQLLEVLTDYSGSRVL